MKIVRYFKPLILVALLLFVSPIKAVEFLLPKEANGIDLTKYVTYTFSEASSPEALLAQQPEFKPIKEKKFEPTPKKLWYKLDLLSEHLKGESLAIYTDFPNVPLLRAYKFDEQGEWQLIFDDTQSFHTRYFQHPIITLPLQTNAPIQTNAPQKVTVLIEYGGLANAPLTLTLYDKENLQNEHLTHITFNSVLISLSLFIFIASLIQFSFSPSNKTGSLALLSLLITFFIGETAGFNFQFLWPQYPHFNKFSPLIFSISTYIVYLFFTVQLFDLKKRSRLLYLTYTWLMVAIFCLLMINFFVDIAPIAFGISLIFAPLPLKTGIWAYKKGLWASQFFIVGALCNVLLNNIYVALTGLGIIHFSGLSIITVTKLGFVLELLIFSIAIVYLTARYKEALVTAEKKEKIEAQKSFEIEKLNKELQIKAQEEFYKKSLIEQRANLMEDLVKKKNQFLADVSHELSTPLTVLKLQVESLKDKMEEDVDAAYDSLDLKLTDLALLIKDIQLFSQCNSGTLKLDLKQLNAKQLLDQWQHELQLCFSDTNLTFTLLNEIPNDVQIKIDLNKIKQTLLNILNNSIKYTDQPGTVKLVCKVIKGQLTFITEDSSPSVKEEHLEKIFDRLYRVENSRSRKTGGSGLGLAICKGLIKVHNGDIRAESSELGGLKVVFSIPTE